MDTLPKANIGSLDFIVTQFLMKKFRSVITDCWQFFFKFHVQGAVRDKKKYIS